MAVFVIYFRNNFQYFQWRWVYNMLSRPEMLPLLGHYARFVLIIQAAGEDFWPIFSNFHKEFKKEEFIGGNHFFKKVTMGVEEQVQKTVSSLIPDNLSDVFSLTTKIRLSIFKYQLIRHIINAANELDDEIVDAGKLSIEKITATGMTLFQEAIPGVQSTGECLIADGTQYIQENTEFGSKLLGVTQFT